jgi:adenosylmethionine-8-amino-7-oxononanoate aminotransferase
MIGAPRPKFKGAAIRGYSAGANTIGGMTIGSDDTTDSLELRSRRFLWHPCTQMKALESIPPLAIVRGEGPWLVDESGRRYLDAISSWWVNLFGHANPRINAALTDQLGRIEHVMLAGCTHPPVVELSERLARLTGLGHAFYGSDGASATEIALKMSFHFWRNAGNPGKNRFVSLRHGYHGETIGALSVTDVALFKDVYSPLLRHSIQVASPDFRLAETGESAEDYALRCAEELDGYLTRHADEIAAFILEPLVQGAAGMAMYHPAYLRRAREICDRYQVHLIADEIAVGFGRTGTMFACEQAGIKPDFMCLSKGITGGYLPLSVVQTTDDVYEMFYGDDTARGFLHSHSYTGNPLACRAACAVLDIFESEGVLQANRNKSIRFNEAMAEVIAHPRVCHFRHQGMIWAFDVKDARQGFSSWWHAQALRQGVLMRPIGNSVYFMPPYVIGPEEMHLMAGCTLELLNDRNC